MGVTPSPDPPETNVVYSMAEIGSTAIASVNDSVLVTSIEFESATRVQRRMVQPSKIMVIREDDAWALGLRRERRDFERLRILVVLFFDLFFCLFEGDVPIRTFTNSHFSTRRFVPMV